MPAGSVRAGVPARVPAVVHRLRLPSRLRLVDRHARCTLLLPILRLLQTGLPQESQSKFYLSTHLLLVYITD